MAPSPIDPDSAPSVATQILAFPNADPSGRAPVSEAAPEQATSGQHPGPVDGFRGGAADSPLAGADLVANLLERQEDVLAQLNELNLRIDAFIEEINQTRQESETEENGEATGAHPLPQAKLETDAA